MTSGAYLDASIISAIALHHSTTASMDMIYRTGGEIMASGFKESAKLQSIKIQPFSQKILHQRLCLFVTKTAPELIGASLERHCCTKRSLDLIVPCVQQSNLSTLRFAKLNLQS